MTSSPVLNSQYGVVIENFNAEGPFEISVKSGELIQVVSQSNPNWTYICRLSDFQQGYIPSLFFCKLATKMLINYLFNQIDSLKVSVEASQSLKSPSLHSISSSSSSSSSSSTSSSCSSLFEKLPNDSLSDSISSCSSLENKTLSDNLNLSPVIKTDLKYKFNRTDPDGGNSSEFSFSQKDLQLSRGTPHSIKIYENIEPNDYEINILHLYNQPSIFNLSSKSSLRTFSSRYEINIPNEIFEIPRRLFIDTGKKYQLLSQELKDSFEKLTLV